jgi:uncharacterized tellurite resistance protein B-like protein
MPAPSSDLTFNTETLKLLLQVAWADHQLAPEERQLIADLGLAWSVPDAVMHQLLAHLDDGTPLPQPNLGLLRGSPDAVIAAAKAFVSADGLVDAEEADFVAQVTELLGR